jgi:alkylation response protein AidB-like acyl-CoA dehydrogenase
MNFDLSSEQIMLRDSANRYVKECGASPKSTDTEVSLSQDFAKLGWLGLSLPEKCGGVGGSAIDVMVLCEELGRGLLLEPYLSVLLAGELLIASEVDARAEHGGVVSSLLGNIVSGNASIAAGLYEPDSRFELAQQSCVAQVSEQGYTLNGTKSFVLSGAQADQLLISARTQGQFNDASGISLFLLDRKTQGLTLNSYYSFDGLPMATLSLSNVVLRKEACLVSNTALSIMEAAVEKVIIALSAQALGAMETLLYSSIEYCQLRQQFGKKITQFQAVQHRFVDMYMACEEVRSLLYAAAVKQAESAPDAKLITAMLKVKVGEAGRFLGEQSVQLHGAMGFTEDLLVGRLYKRLLAIDTLFGNADYHLKRVIKLS